MRALAATRLLIPLLVALAAAAVYLPALGFDFVFDDHPQIELSQPRLAWAQLPGYFTGNVWSHVGRTTNYYRPVFLIWLLLNYQCFGLDPALWHSSTVALHVAATLLLYFLARRLAGDAWTAGMAALLFAVHPVHLEAVAWISGVSEPLSAVFWFGAILCHLRWREQERRRLAWRVAAVSLCALALFEKETALVLPALLCAYEWLFPRPPTVRLWPRLLRAVSATVPYLAAAVAYLAVRTMALGSLAPVPTGWPPAVLLYTLPSVLAFYLLQLARPLHYALFYELAPVLRPAVGNFLLPAAGVGLAAATLYVLSRRSRPVAFGSLLLILPLVPVLDLAAFSHRDFAHDRYLYVPSAGFCVLLALAARRLAERRGYRLVAAAGIPVLGVLGFLTVRESRFWKDDLALTAHAAQVSPASVAALRALGETLAGQGRFAEALPLLRRVLARRLEDYRLQEDDFELYAQIGLCYLEQGELDQAAGYLRDAISMEPRYPYANLYTGVLELRRGRLAEAEGHLRKALALRPQGFFPPYYRRFHYFLGTVLEGQGDWKGALAEYAAELEENPDAEDLRDRVRDLRRRLDPSKPRMNADERR